MSKEKNVMQKRAALRTALQQAIKSGAIKPITKTASVARMAHFLKTAGCQKNEVLFLTNLVKAAARIPSDASFKKVASAVGLDPKLVKAAFLEKKGFGFMLPAALGLGAGMLAGGAMPAMRGMFSNFNQYQMPAHRKALYDKIYNESMGSRQLSQDLQAIGGAYNPAPNPWGSANPHQGMFIGHGSTVI